MALYNRTNKNIKFSIEGIHKHLDNNFQNEQLLDYNDQSYYRSLLVIQTILHELEHARQIKVMAEDDSFESRLISSSLAKMDERTYEYLLLHGFSEEEIKDYFINVIYPRFKILKEKREIMPTERMAEIESTQGIINMLHRLGINSTRLYEIFNKYLNDSLLLGYKSEDGVISNPTDDYLNKLWDGIILDIYPWHNFIDYIYLQNVSNKFNLNERLFYGLPISKPEYAKIRLKQSIYNNRLGQK
jgi:hypothetical protein